MTFIGMMDQVITIEPFSAESNDGWQGGATYGAGVEYQCRIEYGRGERRIILEAGKEHVSSGVAHLNGNVNVGIRDRITLPAGHTPQQPIILEIQKMRTPFGGVGITSIYFGTGT